jgi:excisionase family DNA binding protein
MLDAEPGKDELAALEGYLGDQLAFSLPEAAKMLGRSTRWIQKKANRGELRSVMIGGQRVVSRPVMISILTKGV